MAKSLCNICGQWFEDSELDEHLSKHSEEPEPTTPATTLRCPNCGISPEIYRGIPFKIVGRSDPAARLLLSWVEYELGDEPIPLDLCVCPRCGLVQQYASPETRHRLSQAAPKK